MEGSKTCSKCRKLISTSQFYQNRARTDGLDQYCKPCRRPVSASWRTRNGDRHHENYRDWYRGNKAHKAEYNRSRRAEFPEFHQAAHSRRRQREAAEMSAEDKKASATWRRKHQFDPCAYCGAKSEQTDHIVPLARGGTDHWWNLARACADCNLRKHDKTAEEFMRGEVRISGKANRNP